MGRGRPAWLERIGVAVIAAAILAFALPALAQQIERPPADQPVALIADEIDFDSNTGRVTASGSVEVYYGDRTLTADKIIYDDNTGRVEAIGDIVLRDPNGTTVFADTADLDADLKDGLVTGARSILDKHTRLAAVEARRIDERYNTLSKVVYSPCRVCPDQPNPLWRIRAERVIHDEVEKVIHYENATFDVFGVPIAWLPYFQHPDPTVERSSGLLSPSFHASGGFGYGIKTPYFLTLGDSADLTVTPFLLTEEFPLLELEYRRMFTSGQIRVGGSIGFSNFDGEERVRGHVDAEGLWDIGWDINAGFDINFASDDNFLNFFDLSDDDRLTSEIFLRRYREDGFFDITGVRFQSLRDNEPAGDIPVALPVFDARYDLNEPWLDGTLGIFTSGQILARNNGDDNSRLSFGFDWERQEILPIGLSLSAFAEVRGDIISVIDSDTLEEGTDFRLAPHVGFEARYPLQWVVDDSTSHVIEPIVQGILAPNGGNDDLPVEDSLVVEFDETNVIDRNRFSGRDSVEEGPRLGLLLRYELINDTGLGFDASAGRVYRFRDQDAFSSGSGLATAESDFVAAWNASYDPYFSLSHRMRFNEDFDITRNEFTGRLNLDPVTLTSSYIFLAADPLIGAVDDREELTGTARLKVTSNWSVSGTMRRDLQFDSFVRVGGQITYTNECCAIEAFARRTFVQTTGVPASTTGGIRVKLLTLGGF